MSVGPENTYRDFLASGEFRLQRCRSCKAHLFYPRYLCTVCGSSDLEWVAASGRATVYSTTVTRRLPERGGHFNISLVELAEGPRLMTWVQDIEPENVAIGMAVQAKIAEDKNGKPLLVFIPAGEIR